MQAQEITLKQAIIDVLNHPEDVAKAKKAHASFLRETLILPVQPSNSKEDDPIPLYLEENNAQFLPVFSQERYYNHWAEDNLPNIDLLHLSGNDLIKGTGESVYICLDIGQDHYKQFSPEEVQRLRLVVSKLENLLNKNKKG